MNIKNYHFVEGECPRCKTELVAYKHYHVAEDEETSVWTVECNNLQCEWEHGDIFMDLDHVSETYPLEP